MALIAEDNPKKKIDLLQIFKVLEKSDDFIEEMDFSLSLMKYPSFATLTSQQAAG